MTLKSNSISRIQTVLENIIKRRWLLSRLSKLNNKQLKVPLPVEITKSVRRDPLVLPLKREPRELKQVPPLREAKPMLRKQVLNQQARPQLLRLLQQVNNLLLRRLQLSIKTLKSQ